MQQRNPSALRDVDAVSHAIKVVVIPQWRAVLLKASVAACSRFATWVWFAQKAVKQGQWRLPLPEQGKATVADFTPKRLDYSSLRVLGVGFRV